MIVIIIIMMKGKVYQVPKVNALNFKTGRTFHLLLSDTVRSPGLDFEDEVRHNPRNRRPDGGNRGPRDSSRDTAGWALEPTDSPPHRTSSRGRCKSRKSTCGSCNTPHWTPCISAVGGE